MAKLCVGDIPIGAMNWIRTEEVPEERFGANLDTFIGKVDENGVLRPVTWSGGLNFAGVKEIDDNALQYAFYQRSGITSVDLSSLQSIGSYGLQYAFGNCSGITSINLSSLTTVGTGGLNNVFYGCSKIVAVSFPALTDVQTNSFASSTSSGAFRNCTALTEIHFRADMQATIEALTGYSDKFGATNATVYFDL